jgi:hypothetical protein
MVLKVKQNLDKTDLVYVMVLTEQLFNLPQEDLEHITEMIDQHLNLKYGADVEPE